MCVFMVANIYINIWCISFCKSHYPTRTYKNRRSWTYIFFFWLIFGSSLYHCCGITYYTTCFLIYIFLCWLRKPSRTYLACGSHSAEFVHKIVVVASQISTKQFKTTRTQMQLHSQFNAQGSDKKNTQYVNLYIKNIVVVASQISTKQFKTTRTQMQLHSQFNAQGSHKKNTQYVILLTVNEAHFPIKTCRH